MNWLQVKFNPKRVYGLDILRAIAILFVVYSHNIHFLHKIWPSRYIGMFVLDGVSMFFVLSGFLIGRILIDTFEKEKVTFPVLLNFWIRRWFRTLPNYFLILTILFVFQGLILERTTLSVAWKYYLFIQNFSVVHPVFFQEAWSLSVEEWFYIIVPVLLFVFAKLKLKPKVLFLLTITLLIAFTIYVRYDRFLTLDCLNPKCWDIHFRKQVITRLDSLMFGVLGAWLSYYYFSIWVKYKKTLFIIGSLTLIAQKTLPYFWTDLRWSHNLYYSVFTFSIGAVATLFMIPFLGSIKKGSGRVYRAVTVISLISYSMYLINLTLVHDCFITGLKILFPSPDVWYFHAFYYVLSWSTTIVGSILIYKFFELPVTGFREKFNTQKIKKWLKSLS